MKSKTLLGRVRRLLVVVFLVCLEDDVGRWTVTYRLIGTTIGTGEQVLLVVGEDSGLMSDDILTQGPVR